MLCWSIYIFSSFTVDSAPLGIFVQGKHCTVRNIRPGYIVHCTLQIILQLLGDVGIGRGIKRILVLKVLELVQLLLLEGPTQLMGQRCKPQHHVRLARVEEILVEEVLFDLIELGLGDSVQCTF